MAIRDKIVNGGNGINFTKEVDGSGDHAGLAPESDETGSWVAYV